MLPVKKKKLARNLDSDIEDEKSAIQSYGMRMQQASPIPKLKSKLKHIQSEEKDHKKKLQSGKKLLHYRSK